MIRHPISRTLLLLLAGLLLVGTPAVADDDAVGGETITWGIGPASADGPDGRSSIQLLTEPDQVYQDHVAVRNLSENELALALYPADAVNTTTGGFDIQTDEDENTMAGSWITLGTTGVTLGPRETAVVPFEVAVPQNAEPGDHSAGIVAVLTRTTQEGVSTQNRVGTRVHVRVAGAATPSAAITVDRARFSAGWVPFTRGDVQVTYTITNTGNVRIGGVPRITVRGLFGLGERHIVDEEFVDLLPGNSLERTVEASDVLPLIRASARVDVDDASSGEQKIGGILIVENQDRGLWTVSWPTLLTLLVLIGGPALAWWLRKRRQSPDLRAAAQPAGDEPVPGSAEPDSEEGGGEHEDDRATGGRVPGPGDVQTDERP